MDVLFVTRRGQPFSIEVGFFDTVREIKKKIKKYRGIPIAIQILYFNGQELQDERGVHHYEILQNSRIQLTIPVGYRFHPTDEELVHHYLRLKILGMGSFDRVIPEIEVCKWEPWEVPESDDPEWYFFSPRDVNYPNGHRSKRQTKAGYWKPTGKDRKIISRRTNNLIGMKKTLVFYKGRTRDSQKTSWVIHEYHFTEEDVSATRPAQPFVLCLLKKKPNENTRDEVEPSSVIGTHLNVISNDMTLGQLLGLPPSEFQVHELEGVPENQLVLHSTVGYRFHPTNEELVDHYLRLKILGMDSHNRVIPEVDVCRLEPWELPALSIIKSDDPEWYFFCPRDVNNLNGHRSKRQTEAGYWKPTGKDRKIFSRRTNNLIGMKKTLVFHKGRARASQRTPWVIHEYHFTTDSATRPAQPFVLCLLKKKPDENTVEPDPELEAHVESFNFEPPCQPLELLFEMHPEQRPSHIGFPYSNGISEITIDTEEQEFLETVIVSRDE